MLLVLNIEILYVALRLANKAFCLYGILQGTDLILTAVSLSQDRQQIAEKNVTSLHAPQCSILQYKVHIGSKFDQCLMVGMWMRAAQKSNGNSVTLCVSVCVCLCDRERVVIDIWFPARLTVISCKL